MFFWTELEAPHFSTHHKIRIIFRFIWAELEASGGTLFFAASKEVVFAAGGRLPTSRNKCIKTSPTLCTMFL